MENIEIFGKHTMDMPGFNTVKFLKDRQYNILKKLERNIKKGSYSIYKVREIRALEKAINFIKWINDNNSTAGIKEIIEKYKQEKLNINEETEEITINNDKDETIYAIFNESIGRKRKLDITLSKNGEEKYILIESKRQSDEKISWKKIGAIKMTLYRLERILKKANAIESIEK
jgi:hypothetical protein